MKTNRISRCEYQHPEVELVDVSTELGFALSSPIEDVGKDDEIEF